MRRAPVTESPVWRGEPVKGHPTAVRCRQCMTRVLDPCEAHHGPANRRCMRARGHDGEHGVICATCGANPTPFQVPELEHPPAEKDVELVVVFSPMSMLRPEPIR